MVVAARLAPAKVNLFLHVGPVEANGYHPLASLVAFADVGDRVSVAPADRLSLTVSGPFGGALAGADDNLILRAMRALGTAAGTGEPKLAISLDKQLPIAAGLGGGSSDAGAALKLARDTLHLAFDAAALAEVAGTVGADGPMCLHARAGWAGGHGDRLNFEPRLPALPCLLVNPGVPSSTAAVYRAYDQGPPAAADMPPPPLDWSPAAVVRWLQTHRNDLEGPAIALQPAIAGALAAVRDLPGVRLARMSGSGATVFALFDTREAAAEAGTVLRARQRDWWIEATTLA